MSGYNLYDGRIALISSLIFILSCLTGWTSVIDLRKAICGETSLIHHFSFEGPREDSDILRREDKTGNSRLEKFAINSGSSSYVQGMDSLTMAGSVVYSDSDFNYGAAWRTTNSIALPPSMTVECLFRPDLTPSHDTYVLGTRDGTNERGYYLRQSDDGKLETRIGSGAYRTIVNNYATGHWYYVVSTYSVNAGKTTINSYYADVTAGDELQHAIVNEEENGHYGSSAVLGVGCLALTISQYFAPCTIDEVALYDTVLDVNTIDNHLTELKCALPCVEYREIFPNDASTAFRFLPQEGWLTHWNSNAVHLTNGPVIEKFNTAFDTNIAAIASFPTETGVTQGYLSNHNGPTGTNYLYWTEEMTNQVDISWLKLVQFDARFAATRDISFAVRVDTNATPANTTDDVWYYGSDFDGASGTSAIAIPASNNAWNRYWFEPGAGEWAVLDFEPGVRLIPGDTQVALPTNGLITAFGLFEDMHVLTLNERFDNVTLYTRRVYPPPPPQGTVLMIF